jgi:hypothetical protein
MRTAAIALILLIVTAGCAGLDDSPLMSRDVADPDVAEPAASDFDDAEHVAADEAEARAAGTDAIVAAGPRRLIRDASVELLVEDPDAAVRDIGDLARGAGGFVSGANLTRDSEGRLRGELTIRVPAEDLDRILDDLAELALSEESRSITTRDVTGEYADLQARVRNLRTFEQELLSLLATIREQDARPESLLNVFERIRQVREEIERIEERISTLDDLVAMSTVRVILRTPPPAATLGRDAEVWQPLEVLQAAGRSLLVALQGVANVAIWLAVFVLPLALLLALPLAALSLVGMRRWRQRQGAAGVSAGE